MAFPFPFPFEADTYEYTNNARPLLPPCCFQVNDLYDEEMVLKRRLLEDQPVRTFQALPGTEDAQWEVVTILCRQLARFYPDSFTLLGVGDTWTFHNKRLGETVTFTLYDDASLPCAPLDWIGSQVQEDLLLVGRHDDELRLDAGQLVFAGNWSVVFNLGMPFLRIHEPVPVVNESGLGSRIQRFLLALPPGEPWTRLNWSLNAGRRLDTSPETFAEWGPLRHQVTAENAGELVHLRVEDQTLLQLTEHPALLFTIHTYLMPLSELVQRHDWALRTYRVLNSLSEPLSDYKGITPYRDAVLSYVEQQLGITAQRGGRS